MTPPKRTADVGERDGHDEQSSLMTTTDNVRELVRRLRRKTIGGVAVFPTPIENEAADALDSQQRTIEGLKKDAERLDWLERELFDGKWDGTIECP